MFGLLKFLNLNLSMSIIYLKYSNVGIRLSKRYGYGTINSFHFICNARRIF
jgi:hypothetical protein